MDKRDRIQLQLALITTPIFMIYAGVASLILALAMFADDEEESDG